MLHALTTEEFRETETDDAISATLPTPQLHEVKKLNILLVEDMHSDALLTEIAIKATEIPYSLSRIKRGDKVIPTLNLERIFHPHDLPDLIMLDLGLPGMDGFEILAELATMPAALRAIPIVILTAHEHFDYIRHTYPLCILGYINKPCTSDQMYELLLRARNGRFDSNCTKH